MDFWWSSICFIPAYSQEFSTSLPLEGLWWVKDFQGGFFQFLRVCAHIPPCLGTYLWELKEIDLLNFSFDLSLPVTPLLRWLRLWLTTKHHSLGLLTHDSLGKMISFYLLEKLILQFRMKYLVMRIWKFKFLYKIE